MLPPCHHTVATVYHHAEGDVLWPWPWPSHWGGRHDWSAWCRTGRFPGLTVTWLTQVRCRSVCRDNMAKFLYWFGQANHHSCIEAYQSAHLSVCTSMLLQKAVLASASTHSLIWNLTGLSFTDCWNTRWPLNSTMASSTVTFLVWHTLVFEAVSNVKNVAHLVYLLIWKKNRSRLVTPPNWVLSRNILLLIDQ